MCGASQLIDLCTPAVYLQVDLLLQEIASCFKLAANDYIRNVSMVGLIRKSPSAATLLNRQYHTFEWVDHNDMRASFEAVFRRFYTHPAGSRHLPDIKKILFRLLHVAGARFITTQQIMKLAEDRGMKDFLADIAKARMHANKADRLRVPDDVKFRIMDPAMHCKSLVRLSWICNREGCTNYIFVPRMRYFSIDLAKEYYDHVRGWPHAPKFFCKACTDARLIPDMIQ